MRHWTAEEVGYLEEHCRTESAANIGEKLGRTEWAVISKSYVMGIDTSLLLPEDYMKTAEILELSCGSYIVEALRRYKYPKYWFGTFLGCHKLAYHIDDVMALKKKNESKRKYSREEIMRVIELKKSGMKYAKISAITGIPQVRVGQLYRYWNDKIKFIF